MKNKLLFIALLALLASFLPFYGISKDVKDTNRMLTSNILDENNVGTYVSVKSNETKAVQDTSNSKDNSDVKTFTEEDLKKVKIKDHKVEREMDDNKAPISNKGLIDNFSGKFNIWLGASYTPSADVNNFTDNNIGDKYKYALTAGIGYDLFIKNVFNENITPFVGIGLNGTYRFDNLTFKDFKFNTQLNANLRLGMQFKINSKVSIRPYGLVGVSTQNVKTQMQTATSQLSSSPTHSTNVRLPENAEELFFIQTLSFDVLPFQQNVLVYDNIGEILSSVKDKETGEYIPSSINQYSNSDYPFSTESFDIDDIIISNLSGEKEFILHHELQPDAFDDGYLSRYQDEYIVRYGDDLQITKDLMFEDLYKYLSTIPDYDPNYLGCHFIMNNSTYGDHYETYQLFYLYFDKNSFELLPEYKLFYHYLINGYEIENNPLATINVVDFEAEEVKQVPIEDVVEKFIEKYGKKVENKQINTKTEYKVGLNAGVGVDVVINDRFIVGGEDLYNVINNLETHNVGLKVGYQF